MYSLVSCCCSSRTHLISSGTCGAQLRPGAGACVKRWKGTGLGSVFVNFIRLCVCEKGRGSLLCSMVAVWSEYGTSVTCWGLTSMYFRTAAHVSIVANSRLFLGLPIHKKYEWNWQKFDEMLVLLRVCPSVCIKLLTEVCHKSSPSPNILNKFYHGSSAVCSVQQRRLHNFR